MQLLLLQVLMLRWRVWRVPHPAAAVRQLPWRAAPMICRPLTDARVRVERHVRQRRLLLLLLRAASPLRFARFCGGFQQALRGCVPAREVQLRGVGTAAVCQ